MSIPGTLHGQPLEFNMAPQLLEDLRQARREIELLKTMVCFFRFSNSMYILLHVRQQDPFRAAEMAIEIQLERMRVSEAMTARDNIAHRLTDAHLSIRQKVETIQRLELEKEELTRKLPANLHHDASTATKETLNEDTNGLTSKAELELETKRLRAIITGLQEQVKLLRETRSECRKPSVDPPPRYEEGKSDNIKVRD